MKRKRLFHAEMLKQDKMVRRQNINAPKNPFNALSYRPAKIPRIDETSVYTSHVVSAHSIVNESSTTDAIATITYHWSCNSTKIRESFSASSEKHGKQFSTIQKPLATDDMPHQCRYPKCFLDCGISNHHNLFPAIIVSNHHNLIMKIGRHGTLRPRKGCRILFHTHQSC